MTVYLVEYEMCADSYWIEKVFDSRQKADEYCISIGCTQRMSEDINTSWQEPDSRTRCHVIEMEVE